MTAKIWIVLRHDDQMSPARFDVATAAGARVRLARLIGLDHIDDQRIVSRTHPSSTKPSPDHDKQRQCNEAYDQNDVGHSLVLLAKRIESHGAQRSRPVSSC